jgi:hypothetical protein
MTQYYDIYCRDILNCEFCGSASNLYYIKTHLKKSTRCCEIQNKLKAINENKYNEKLLDFKLKINKLKSEIRMEA